MKVKASEETNVETEIDKIEQISNNIAVINGSKTELEKILDQINRINGSKTADEEEEEYDEPPPMVSWHDQDSNSDSDSEDEEEGDQINLPILAWVGNIFKEENDPINLHSSTWGGEQFPGRRMVRQKQILILDGEQCKQSNKQSGQKD